MTAGELIRTIVARLLPGMKSGGAIRADDPLLGKNLAGPGFLSRPTIEGSEDGASFSPVECERLRRALAATTEAIQKLSDEVEIATTARIRARAALEEARRVIRDTREGHRSAPAPPRQPFNAEDSIKRAGGDAIAADVDRRSAWIRYRDLGQRVTAALSAIAQGRFLDAESWEADVEELVVRMESFAKIEGPK
jgi:hypothetical protein